MIDFTKDELYEIEKMADYSFSGNTNAWVKYQDLLFNKTIAGKPDADKLSKLIKEIEYTMEVMKSIRTKCEVERRK